MESSTEESNKVDENANDVVKDTDELTADKKKKIIIGACAAAILVIIVLCICFGTQAGGASSGDGTSSGNGSASSSSSSQTSSQDFTTPEIEIVEDAPSAQNVPSETNGSAGRQTTETPISEGTSTTTTNDASVAAPEQSVDVTDGTTTEQPIDGQDSQDTGQSNPGAGNDSGNKGNSGGNSGTGSNAQPTPSGNGVHVDKDGNIVLPEIPL
jgi:cytoskeletal protein RodZ